MNTISTHVLDTTIGRPAAGIPVVLELQKSGDTWTVIGKGETDADGRVKSLLGAETNLAAGTYRMTFTTQSYFAAAKRESFYPYVTIVFTLPSGNQHYHVPLLMSGYGFSTYRGS